MTYFPAILLMISIVAVTIEVWTTLVIHRLPDTTPSYDEWKLARSFNVMIFMTAGLIAGVFSSLALGYLIHENGLFSANVLLVSTLTLLSAFGTVCMGRRIAIMAVWIARDNVHKIDNVRTTEVG
jgi:hypothetical protein